MKSAFTAHFHPIQQPPDNRAWLFIESLPATGDVLIQQHYVIDRGYTKLQNALSRSIQPETNMMSRQQSRRTCLKGCTEKSKSRCSGVAEDKPRFQEIFCATQFLLQNFQILESRIEDPECPQTERPILGFSSLDRALREKSLEMPPQVSQSDTNIQLTMSRLSKSG